MHISGNTFFWYSSSPRFSSYLQIPNPHELPLFFQLPIYTNVSLTINVCTLPHQALHHIIHAGRHRELLLLVQEKSHLVFFITSAGSSISTAPQGFFHLFKRSWSDNWSRHGWVSQHPANATLDSLSPYSLHSLPYASSCAIWVSLNSRHTLRTLFSFYRFQFTSAEQPHC